MPLLCLAVLFVFRRRWWAFVPLMALQVIVYPMVAIHTGMLLIVDTLYHDWRRLKDKQLWWNKLLPLALAATIVIVVIASKYLISSHGFGELTDRVDIGNRIEFSSKGRGYLIPVPSFTHQMDKFWGNPFHLSLLALAFVVLGRGVLRLPRGLWSLFVASLVLYVFADLLLIRLYFPNRYVWRSFPLIMAFTGAATASEIRERGKASIASLHVRLCRFGSLPRWAAAAVLLTALGAWTFKKTLIPPGGSAGRSYAHFALYDAIKALPGRPMIAAPPKRSELPVMTGRTVLITKELAHPWWTEYWKIQVERHHDFFRAYFGNNPEQIRSTINKYHIDYWVVDRHEFVGFQRHPRFRYFRPFDRWIAQHLPRSNRSLLASVPRRLQVWSGKRFFIVSSEGLLAWLNAPRPKVRWPARTGGPRK